mmetsp:Transcript_3130/g.12709  ORF Transcript_3130/g.12709 Transcript_3130/m.12709 type:complete len:698 (+) Transcript_3130:20-2113(+)
MVASTSYVSSRRHATRTFLLPSRAHEPGGVLGQRRLHLPLAPPVGRIGRGVVRARLPPRKECRIDQLEARSLGGRHARPERGERLHHVLVRDLRLDALAALGGIQRLVRCGQLRVRQQRLQVGAGEAGRVRGHACEHLAVFEVVGEPRATAERAHDLRALDVRREVDVQQPVEAPGAQKRRVDQIGPRGGRHHHHARQRLDAVELREQLVDDAIGHARGVVAAARRQRVELVEEERARSCCARLGEQLANSSLGLSDVLVEQLGALDADVTHSAGGGGAARDVRFAAAWRAEEEHARACAQRRALEQIGVQSRHLEHLPELVLDVVQSADVVPPEVGVHLARAAALGARERRRREAALGRLEIRRGDLEHSTGVPSRRVRLAIGVQESPRGAVQRTLEQQLDIGRVTAVGGRRRNLGGLGADLEVARGTARNEEIAARAFFGRAKPHNHIEAPRSAHQRVEPLGVVGGGEPRDAVGPLRRAVHEVSEVLGHGVHPRVAVSALRLHGEEQIEAIQHHQRGRVALGDAPHLQQHLADVGRRLADQPLARDHVAVHGRERALGVGLVQHARDGQRERRLSTAARAVNDGTRTRGGTGSQKRANRAHHLVGHGPQPWQLREQRRACEHCLVVRQWAHGHLAEGQVWAVLARSELLGVDHLVRAGGLAGELHDVRLATREGRAALRAHLDDRAVGHWHLRGA